MILPQNIIMNHSILSFSSKAAKLSLQVQANILKISIPRDNFSRASEKFNLAGDVTTKLEKPWKLSACYRWRCHNLIRRHGNRLKYGTPLSSHLLYKGDARKVNRIQHSVR